MSNWDFGYSREPADPRDPQYPPPPGGAGGPRRPRGRRGRSDAGWPGAEGYPDAERYPDAEGWPSRDGTHDPQAAPYPLTYERDDFDQRPTGPWQAEPRRAPRPTSPGRAVPQRPASGQTGTWQTAPPLAATQRPAPAQAPPRPASPWTAAPPPTGQFGADQYGADQYAGGQPGYADGDRGYASGQRGYANGQPGYADGQRGYVGGQRGGAADPFEPWSAGYPSGTLGNRDSAGTRPPLYPDSQADGEPWLDDSRGPRLGGPWWDPDSWPDWRRWLIPVGVALLAAAVGATLVLLTGMHAGASAAVGQANSTAQARPATFPVNDLSGLVFVEVFHAMRVIFFHQEKSIQDLLLPAGAGGPCY